MAGNKSHGSNAGKQGNDSTRHNNAPPEDDLEAQVLTAIGEEFLEPQSSIIPNTPYYADPNAIAAGTTASGTTAFLVPGTFTTLPIRLSPSPPLTQDQPLQGSPQPIQGQPLQGSPQLPQNLPFQVHDLEDGAHIAFAHIGEMYEAGQEILARAHIDLINDYIRRDYNVDHPFREAYGAAIQEASRIQRIPIPRSIQNSVPQTDVAYQLLNHAIYILRTERAARQLTQAGAPTTQDQPTRKTKRKRGDELSDKDNSPEPKRPKRGATKDKPFSIRDNDDEDSDGSDGSGDGSGGSGSPKKRRGPPIKLTGDPNKDIARRKQREAKRRSRERKKAREEEQRRLAEAAAAAAATQPPPPPPPPAATQPAATQPEGTQAEEPQATEPGNNDTDMVDADDGGTFDASVFGVDHGATWAGLEGSTVEDMDAILDGNGNSGNIDPALGNATNQDYSQGFVTDEGLFQPWDPSVPVIDPRTLTLNAEEDLVFDPGNLVYDAEEDLEEDTEIDMGDALFDQFLESTHGNDTTTTTPPTVPDPVEDTPDTTQPPARSLRPRRGGRTVR